MDDAEASGHVWKGVVRTRPTAHQARLVDVDADPVEVELYEHTAGPGTRAIVEGEEPVAGPGLVDALLGRLGVGVEQGELVVRHGNLRSLGASSALAAPADGSVWWPDECARHGHHENCLHDGRPGRYTPTQNASRRTICSFLWKVVTRPSRDWAHPSLPCDPRP